MRTKRTKRITAIERIRASMERRGIEIDGADIEALRRCEMTLHRWAELECGDGNDYQSWAIERDEGSGVPYMVYHPHNGTPTRRHKIADREAGALKRVAEICRRLGLHFFHQTDPRGVALYVSKDRMTDCDYSSKGVACNG